MSRTIDLLDDFAYEIERALKAYAQDATDRASASAKKAEILRIKAEEHGEAAIALEAARDAYAQGATASAETAKVARIKAALAAYAEDAIDRAITSGYASEEAWTEAKHDADQADERRELFARFKEARVAAEEAAEAAARIETAEEAVRIEATRI